MTWPATVAFTLLISLLFLNNFSAKTQPVAVDSLLAKTLASDVLLPVLIEAAIKYSPEMRKAGSNEAFANANLQVNKRFIYNAFSLLSSYNYGTNYSAINNTSGSPGGNNFTTGQTAFYNIGIGMQLPLTHVINRKHIIKAGQSLVNVAIADKDISVLLIKQEVIRLYQDFKLFQKLMIVAGKNKQAAELNNAMAEKGFLNGQITIDEVSRVLEIYNKAIIESETYVNRFQTSFMQLEAYTGTDLSTLIMRFK